MQTDGNGSMKAEKPESTASLKTKSSPSTLTLDPAFSAWMLDLYGACLSCPKRLEDKDIKKRHLRCKKCQREYENVWPANKNTFLGMFGEEC